MFKIKMIKKDINPKFDKLRFYHIENKKVIYVLSYDFTDKQYKIHFALKNSREKAIKNSRYTEEVTTYLKEGFWVKVN